ncbi:two pore domain potassium channel family protein [Vibrio vulnificus]|nr:two pore domain potassium channel family protein [Vibrio vulnificus]
MLENDASSYFMRFKVKQKNILFSLFLNTIVFFVASEYIDSVVLRASNVIAILVFTTIHLVSLSNRNNTLSPIRTVFYLNVVMLIIIIQYARIYCELEVTTDFLSALYFSVITWTTLGYGDISPVGQARFFAATQAMIGYVYMGIVVAQIFHLISGPKVSGGTK